MPEIIPCPECAKKIKVPDGAEGKKLRCGNCESILLVTEDGLEVARKAAVQTTAEKPASRPARKPAPADEDEDEGPKRKRTSRVEDEDEEDDPRPKRGKRDEDEEDEDERPAKKKKKRKKSGGIPLWVWIASGAAACVLVGVVLWLVLSGGGGKFSKIKQGMTEKEVTDLIGKPTISMFDVAVWFDPPIDEGDLFNIDKTKKVKASLTVLFENGKVKETEIMTGSDLKSGKKSKFGQGGRGNPFGGP